MTNHGCMDISFKRNPNHPNGNVQKGKTEKSTSVRSNVKFFHTLFCDYNAVWHHEFLLQRFMIGMEYYLEVMQRFREAIRQKCTVLWKSQSQIFHHDNALTHTSMLLCEFLNKNKNVIMPLPPYSSDLAPSDLVLLTRLKTLMTKKCFPSIEQIKEKSKEELLPLPTSAFLKCFED